MPFGEIDQVNSTSHFPNQYFSQKEFCSIHLRQIPQKVFMNLMCAQMLHFWNYNHISHELSCYHRHHKEEPSTYQLQASAILVVVIDWNIWHIRAWKHHWHLHVRHKVFAPLFWTQIFAFARNMLTCQLVTHTFVNFVVIQQHVFSIS